MSKFPVALPAPLRRHEGVAHPGAGNHALSAPNVSSAFRKRSRLGPTRRAFLRGVGLREISPGGEALSLTSGPSAARYPKSRRTYGSASSNRLRSFFSSCITSVPGQSVPSPAAVLHGKSYKHFHSQHSFFRNQMRILNSGSEPGVI